MCSHWCSAVMTVFRSAQHWLSAGGGGEERRPVFVKICGVTNQEDALLATALGADAVGFIFAPSNRQVATPIVRDIVRQLPPEVMTVGVFRDQSRERVEEVVHPIGLRAAPLPGTEAPAPGRPRRRGPQSSTPHGGRGRHRSPKV